MTLVITDWTMTSDVTHHTATRHPDQEPGERGWIVSWLPDRHLDRNQAITAMTLAEAVTEEAATSDESSALIGSLAHELGMTAAEAIQRVTA